MQDKIRKSKENYITDKLSLNAVISRAGTFFGSAKEKIYNP